jgi:carbonic anhydrase
MTLDPRLIPVASARDILPAYRGTPVGELIGMHNLGRRHKRHTKAAILIGMCMDNRKSLRLPENFAFVLRVGGANINRMLFKISFAIAVGGIRAIAIVAHDQCGMAELPGRRAEFVRGLVAVGWKRKVAEAHYKVFAPVFAIPEPVGFAAASAADLRARYPKVLVAPLLYRIEDNRLYQIREK